MLQYTVYLQVRISARHYHRGLEHVLKMKGITSYCFRVVFFKEFEQKLFSHWSSFIFINIKMHFVDFRKF